MSNVQEIWKQLKEINDSYWISNLGNLKVENSATCQIKRKKRYLKPTINRGYLRYSIMGGKRRYKGYYAHRLIAIYFIPNPKNKPHINHIDGNKLNNSITNLEWCTHAENIRHSYRTGLNRCYGENNGQHKLSDSIALEIRAKYKPRVYSSRMLGREYGVSKSTILAIVKNRHWVKEYKESVGVVSKL